MFKEYVTSENNMGVLAKESYSNRSINLNRQTHQILIYYWISNEYVKELATVTLIVLMILRYSIQPPH